MRTFFYTLFTLSIFLYSHETTAQYSEKEMKMGQKVVNLMEETYGFYEDAELQAWVESIGRRLEAHLDGDYKFTYFITDQSELNAFATAGGYVFVTRGLLALVCNEDELAGVLAHEISHVTEKHASKSNRASILPSLLELPGNIVGLITYSEIGNIINLPITLSSDLVLSGYSRNQEREADKLGAALAHKAGYDPYMLINALEKLDAFSETAYHIKSKKNVFDDHPMTEDRSKYLNELLGKMKVEPTEPKSGTNILAQDHLLFGQNPRKPLIKDNVAIHLGLRFYMEFPKSYKLNSGSGSLTAVSHDGKSSILINIDSLISNPEVAGKYELSKLNDVQVLEQEKIRINGLESYKAVVQYNRIKYPDIEGKIYWVKNPVSGVMIRIVTLSPLNNTDKRLEDAIASLRMLKYDEIDEWTYMDIKLEDNLDIKAINDKNPQYARILQIMNNLEKDEYEVDEGMKYKMIEEIPLSNFK